MASKLNIQQLESTTSDLVLSNVRLDMSNSSDFMNIPAGTSDQRGTPQEGAIRWNYDYDSLEFYNGTIWKVINKSKDTDNIVTSGMVLHLDAADKDSYPGTGTQWYDISGYNNHFTSNNTPTFVDGTMQFALGSADGFYSIGTNDFYFGSGDMTVEMWILMTTVGDATNTYYWVWNLGLSRSSSQGDDVYMNQWRSGLRPGELFNRFNNGVTLGYAGTQKLSGLGWTHIVLQSVSGVARWYWDGVLVESTGVPSYNTTAGLRYMEIGNRSLASGYGGSFPGNISQVRYYNRALTEDEILQNYNATRERLGV